LFSYPYCRVKLKVTKSYNKKQSLALVLDILRQCLLSIS
jgi:hypothetical protein